MNSQKSRLTAIEEQNRQEVVANWKAMWAKQEAYKLEEARKLLAAELAELEAYRAAARKA